MIDTLNQVILFFTNYPVLFFSLVGYWAGWVIREKGLYKIILLLFFLYHFLPILININEVYIATLSFLASIGIGYLGMDKVKYYAGDIFYTIKNIIKR